MRNIARHLHHQTMFLAATKTVSRGFLSRVCPLSPPARGAQGPEKSSGNGVPGQENSLPSKSSHPFGWEKSPRYFFFIICISLSVIVTNPGIILFKAWSFLAKDQWTIIMKFSHMMTMCSKFVRLWLLTISPKDLTPI